MGQTPMYLTAQILTMNVAHVPRPISCSICYERTKGFCWRNITVGDGMVFLLELFSDFDLRIVWPSLINEIIVYDVVES